MDDGQLLNFFASLTAALVVGIFSFLGVRHSRQGLEHREVRTREQEAERLLRRYRDPLIWAAFDLQSRLYNIVTHDFLGKYLLRGTEAERQYARDNTIYVIGEYLGWVEILRREIQFMDLRDVTRNRELAKRLEAITAAFLEELPDTTLRLFRGEQRAIGEAMMSSLASGVRESLGYAAFVSRAEDPTFARWFGKLRADIELLAKEPGSHIGRVVSVQHLLIDLLDFLDPTHQYFPESQRHRVRSSTPIESMPSGIARAASPGIETATRQS
jgi:hypothetical protein